MNYLAIAAIVKREGRYLDEWITYHKYLGVEHFYIYDNNDVDDGTIEVCSKFPEVERIVWPGYVQQPAVHTSCIQTFRNASRWIAFIDVDEFFVPVATKKLPELLSNYEKYAALCVHWRLFGSNKQTVYSAFPVTERFTRCAPEIDRHIKSIVDPSRTLNWVTAHRFTHTYIAVDEAGRMVPEMESRPEPATADLVQLNHYVTKSYEECYQRRSAPGVTRADMPENRTMATFFPGHDRNEVEDLRARDIYRRANENR